MSEGAKEIIENNIKVVYRFSQPDERYPYLSNYIKKASHLRRTLLSILNWLKDKEVYRNYSAYTFNIATSQINDARNRKTKAASNHHINFLCLVGLFKKVRQIPGSKSETKINRDFRAKNEKGGKEKKPIGTYRLVKYNEQNLGKIEELCKYASLNGITPGNISYDTLHAADLDDMANLLYPDNNKSMSLKKDAAYQRIIELLSQSIAEKGYCTKPELRGLYKAETGAYAPDEAKKCEDFVDDIMSKYKLKWKKLFSYKPPKDSEIKEYGLNGRDYIYIAR